MAEVDSLRNSGIDVPEEQIRRVQTELKEARRQRNWDRAGQVLTQAEARVAELRQSSAGTTALPQEGDTATVQATQPAGAGLRGSWTPPATSRRPTEGGYFGIGYTRAGLASMFAAAGATSSKVPLVAWGGIEPKPPVNGRHAYDWRKLDSIVTEYHDAGLDLHFVLKAANPWAMDKQQSTTGGISTPGMSISTFPAAEHVDDYRAFVSAIVERYDHDGQNDMPGLRRAVNHFQIESEAQHAGFWRGTKEQYGELLRIAYTAAKQANPRARITVSGINLATALDDSPTEAELQQRLRKATRFQRKSYDFIVYSLQQSRYFDIVEFHYNRDFRAAAPTVQWIRDQAGGRGDQITVWAGDACSAPWLFEKHSRFETPPYPDKEILRDLQANRRTAAATWFRKEQAALTVKRSVTGAHAGLAQIIILSGVDMKAYNESKLTSDATWTVAGLLEDDGRTPRPAYHAYKQMTGHLAGFQAVTQLPVDAGEAFLYRFDGMPGGPVVVGWSARDSVKVKLPADSPAVSVEALALTDRAQSRRLPVSGGLVSIVLGKNTVYLKASN